MVDYITVLAISSLLVIVQLLSQPIAPCSAAAVESDTLARNKRLLPGPQDGRRCDPTRGLCRKGDWVDERIADCEYDRTYMYAWLPPYTCTASGGYKQVFSWVVQPEKDDRCKPVSGKRIRCGDPGTNTRCVCSDYKVIFNKCVCQYWMEETPGEHQPAFCTTRYLGGTSGVHHWTCCNNCNDTTPNTCDGHTYQGGSIVDYCGPCGENIAGDKGQDKHYFNCGSCKTQSDCESECNSRFFLNLPGLCWKWADCFYKCCRARALK